MRAKMQVSHVETHSDNDGNTTHENVKFSAVSKTDGYPEDGSDENNTYAKFTPTAELEMMINNPALFGKHVEGDEYYVDFTKA